MIDLDAAEKLANAATQPGPWVSVVQDGNATVVDAHGMWVADCGAAPDDAAFIAASRQLVPALIAEVRRLSDVDAMASRLKAIVGPLWSEAYCVEVAEGLVGR